MGIGPPAGSLMVAQCCPCASMDIRNIWQRGPWTGNDADSSSNLGSLSWIWPSGNKATKKSCCCYQGERFSTRENWFDESVWPWMMILFTMWMPPTAPPTTICLWLRQLLWPGWQLSSHSSQGSLHLSFYTHCLLCGPHYSGLLRLAYWKVFPLLSSSEFSVHMA